MLWAQVLSKNNPKKGAAGCLACGVQTVEKVQHMLDFFDSLFY